MDNITTLLNASVDEARSLMECLLVQDALKARALAQKALDAVPALQGNMTRIAMLRTIIRRADKQLLATSK